MLALAGAATTPAPAETRPGYGGALIGSLLSEPVEIDPVRARTHAEVTLVTLLFDTLYRAGGKEADGSLRVVPHVAASLPEVSPSPSPSSDGGDLRVRIAIRPGIVFHDGTLLTAEDVARSLERVMASEAGWLVGPVRSVAAEPGEAAIVLELSRPAPELGTLLTAPATSITPRGTAPSWRRAVGSGPFKLDRIERERRRIRLGAANNHFAGRPYIDSLELGWFERSDDEATAYEAGRAHFSLRGQVAYPGHKPTYRTAETTGPAAVLAYVGFGRSAALRPVLQSVDLRRALSLALDRNGFRGVGTGEQVVAAVVPAPLAMDGPAAGERERQARLDQARQALALAGRRVPRLAQALAGQKSLSLEVIIDRSRPDDREIAEKVITALFRLGITARITDLPAGEHGDRVRRGECDLYIGQLVAPVPTAALLVAAAFAAGSDDWAARRLGRAPLQLDVALRAFAERMPVVPLFHRALRVHHRVSVRGVSVDDAALVPWDDLYLSGKDQRSP